MKIIEKWFQNASKTLPKPFQNPSKIDENSNQIDQKGYDDVIGTQKAPQKRPRAQNGRPKGLRHQLAKSRDT